MGFEGWITVEVKSIILEYGTCVQHEEDTEIRGYLLG